MLATQSDIASIEVLRNTTILSRSKPFLVAQSFVKDCSASTHRTIPPRYWQQYAKSYAIKDFPEDSSPKSSMILPKGHPPPVTLLKARNLVGSQGLLLSSTSPAIYWEGNFFCISLSVGIFIFFLPAIISSE